MPEKIEEATHANPNFGDHFPTAERDLLIVMCAKRDHVSAALFPERSDCRDRGRLEDALEQLLELIQYEKK